MDVKKIGDAGNAGVQVSLVGVSLLCAALYIALELLSRDLRRERSALRTVTVAWWMYIALSPLPVLLRAVNFEHYLKVLLPFVLFGVALAVMSAAERRGTDPALSLDILLWGAFISTAWRGLYAVAIGGLSIDTIRWQILGPGVPFLVGYGAAGLYLRRHRAVALVALFAALVCVLLSITRSYLVTGLVVIGGLLVVDARRRTKIRAALSAARFLATLTLVIGVAAAITAFARPNFIDTWIARLFHNVGPSGLDITLVTRLAEYRGQLNALTQSALTLLVGNGLGADYTWDSSILRGLPFHVHEPVRWFAGHSTWVYPFFSSGVIVGAIVPLILLAALVRGLSAASTSKGYVGSNDVVSAFVIYLAYLGQSLTANIMHERYTALILGIVSGAIFIYAGRVREGSCYRVHSVVRTRDQGIPDNRRRN